MMAGYFRLPQCQDAGVTVIVSVFVTDFDHRTHFLLGGDIIYVVTSVERISPPLSPVFIYGRRASVTFPEL
jgi:hypothetical protein